MTYSVVVKRKITAAAPRQCRRFLARIRLTSAVDPEKTPQSWK